jgi:hypothetical protein
MAAVLNGNVVVGALNLGQRMVGLSGTKVLAIQDGESPTTKISAANNSGGIQIWSKATDSNPAVSTFHLMNGNGNVIKLFKGAQLSGINVTTVSTTTPVYNAAVAGVINNMRTRINELEARLIAIGFLPVTPNPPIDQSQQNNNNPSA